MKYRIIGGLCVVLLVCITVVSCVDDKCKTCKNKGTNESWEVCGDELTDVENSAPYKEGTVTCQ
jgi:hypothetical protein